MDKLKQLEKTPPEEFVVERNHDADLEFRGWLLCGERAADWSGERWTEIDLFRTVGGKLIVAVRQGSTTRGTMRQAGGVCEDGDGSRVAARGRQGTLRACQQGSRPQGEPALPVPRPSPERARRMR